MQVKMRSGSSTSRHHRSIKQGRRTGLTKLVFLLSTSTMLVISGASLSSAAQAWADSVQIKRGTSRVGNVFRQRLLVTEREVERSQPRGDPRKDASA